MAEEYRSIECFYQGGEVGTEPRVWNYEKLGGVVQVVSAPTSATKGIYADAYIEWPTLTESFRFWTSNDQNFRLEANVNTDSKLSISFHEDNVQLRLDQSNLMSSQVLERNLNAAI
ncbi:MAG: hypothetical protein U0930_15195 [Pirellulales bacterium]